jgi:hypothetical protein
MGPLGFLFWVSPTASPSPLVSPTPLPSPEVVSSSSSLLDSTIIAKLVLSALTGVIGNPIVGGPVMIAVMGLIYYAWTYIKKQLRDMEVKRAKDQTLEGQEDFIRNQVTQNKNNTEKDNEGRDQLEKMP